MKKYLLALALTLPSWACDDGGSGGAADAMASADATPDAAGPCQSNGDCDGRICIEGECLDCVQDSECADHPAGDSCLAGACCASGTAGCVCGAGCGEGLACQADRCVPATPCPEGTAGCPCGDGCGADLRCESNTCVDCPAGTVGCACGDGCGDDAACEADVCVRVVPVACADLDCAAQGRVCDERGVDAVCGDCDLAAGFVDDGGECVMLNVCASDADCDGGLRCLQIQADGPRNCAAPPECTILTPAAGRMGAAWSPRDGACVPCGACAGEGVTGALWPTTTNRGECVCETTDGFFFDTALDTGAQRACDSDGDGWVVLTAQRFVESDDPVLTENARCAVTEIERVVLRNERGEELGLDPADLGWAGPQPRYEAPLTDLGESGDDVIPAWGARAPAPARLNPLTKICSTTIDDFNGNGFSDVQEHGRMAPLAGNEWAEPWFRLAHFIELHTQTFADGVLTIAEIPRCDDAFPFAYAGVESAHWRECERRRPADFERDVPGFDFGSLVCDAEAGSCPGLSADELVPAGAFPAQACSGGPTGRFTGMLHHSQFQCVLTRPEGTPIAAPNERAVGDPRTQLRVCGLGDDDGVRCEATAEPPSVLWALADGTSPSGDAYVRGCQAECATALEACPAFPDAGCSVRAFGRAECNRCPADAAACETGLPGVCGVGQPECVNDVVTCGLTADIAQALGRSPAGEGPALDTRPIAPDAPILSQSDDFDDLIDTNCDGFAGRLSTARFVDVEDGDRRGDGSANRPWNDLSLALRQIARLDGNWTLYIKGQPGAQDAALTIPSNVVAIRGAVGDCEAGFGLTVDWCPGAEPTRIVFNAPLGLDVRPSEDQLTIENVNIVIAPENPRPGGSHIGMRVNQRDVRLVASAIQVADAPAGLPGADGAAGQDGAPGDAGSTGCRIIGQIAVDIGGLACRGACPDGYWTSGRGADCVCGGGDSCRGGDGGEGGYPRTACQAIDDEAPTPGQSGEGASPGTGGMANILACGGDDPVPPAANGSGSMIPGANGASGEAPAMSGFFSPDGWVGFFGATGDGGRNGSGGGGGGGGNGRGTTLLECRRRGGHGAGGGSGGCGGLPGQAGGPGGASIGVVVANARVLCDVNCTITAGRGGDGGAGGVGGVGGRGGRGGASSAANGNADLQGDASHGGRGGDGSLGGDGAPGGGGAGGPSAAVVYVGGPAQVPELQGTLNCGGPGAGGPGGAEDADQVGPQPMDLRPGGCIVVAPDQVCADDTHCPFGQYCLDGGCERLLADGEACEDHAECLSDYCDGESDVCAPQGLDAWDAGLQRCTVDQGCESGLCVRGACETPCAGTPDCDATARVAGIEYCNSAERPYCSLRQGTDNECARNDNCLSNYCDGICVVPCDDTDDCDAIGFGLFCDGRRCRRRLNIGEDCPGNDSCVSGAYCDERDICQPLLADGEGCALRGGDGACQSGICNTICVACENNGQCPAGRYCSLGGVNRCELIRQEGDACTNGEDDGCEGDLVCDQGECRAPCDDDADCRGRAWCDEDDGVGCFCRSGQACKRGLDIGQACTEDRICKDDDTCVGAPVGRCRDCTRRADGSSPGCQGGQVCDQQECMNPIADGRACDRDDECARGSQCVDDVCRRECDDSSDCAAGQYCRTPLIGVDRCEPQLAEGENCNEQDACRGDLFCANGQCSECADDGDCARDEWCDIGNPNVCRNDRSYGEPCNRAAQCEYNSCSLTWGCRDCTDDDDCRNHPGGPVCRTRFIPNRCAP